MAKTSFLTIPEGLDLQYKNILQSGNRFIIPRMRVKRRFTSRSFTKGLTQRSLMVSLAPVWEAFDTGVKEAWGEAGAESNMTGWKQFIQDTSVRIANGLPDYATPSTLHQSKVGRIHIESPAEGLQIVQLHPQIYYVSRKVSGTRSQYEPVQITEALSLPLTIEISYSADLTSLGSGSRARLFVIVYSNYQGRTIENFCEIPFTFSQAWTRETAEITGVIGQFRGYTAFIEVVNATGDLYFDNVVMEHDGMNWARDPFCNNIATSFTKAFYQVPKNWATDDIDEGAQYGSVYPPE